jgi:hypothetical protein
MKIWLIGADKKAIHALQQLHKNAAIEVIVSAEGPSPRAVQEGVIDKVDRMETVTSLNVNQLAKRIRPDLILIDPTAGERSYGRVEGGMALADALTYEIAAISAYPCLVL